MPPTLERKLAEKAGVEIAVEWCNRKSNPHPKIVCPECSLIDFLARPIIESLLKQARLDERERCAKIAEDIKHGGCDDLCKCPCQQAIAAQIRKAGEATS
jgi:hypothetical protein